MRKWLASQSFFTEVREFTSAAQSTLRESPFRKRSSSSALLGRLSSAPIIRMIRSASLSPWARTAAPATLPRFLIFAPALPINPRSLSLKPSSPRY